MDVGGSLGYKDESAIPQILKRLETRLRDQPQLARHISLLQGEFEKITSSVNGLLPKSRELLP